MACAFPTHAELVVIDEGPAGFPAHDLPPSRPYSHRLRARGDLSDRREAPSQGRSAQEAIRRGGKRLATLEATRSGSEARDSHSEVRNSQGGHQVTSREADRHREPPEPHAAESARIQEQFEESMSEKGLLEEDGSLALEPEAIEHEEPPEPNRRPANPFMAASFVSTAARETLPADGAAGRSLLRARDSNHAVFVLSIRLQHARWSRALGLELGKLRWSFCS